MSRPHMPTAGAWIKSLEIVGHAAPSPTPALDCDGQIHRQTRWLQQTRGGIPVGLDAHANALMRCPQDSGSSDKPDCVARLSRQHVLAHRSCQRRCT
jgi:hypothetical protein